jgi:hypothetical protein
MPRQSLTSEAARRLAARRKTFSTGRPRDLTVARCPCEVMTLKRAEARGKSYEHDPSCTFYPDQERAIIV